MRVGAIVLAGGLSRRMGEVNKLTLPIADKPLLRHVVDTLLHSKLASVHVVLGYQADTTRPLLDGLAVTLVDNPNFAEGQMTSVHAGLQAVQGRLDAVMVCLADQALLTSEDINDLITCYTASDQQRILVPVWQGQRGNPIIIPASQVDTIVAGERNLGCKRLIEKNPQLTLACPMDTDHVVFDLDTATDYQHLLQRMGQTEPVYG